MDISLKGWGKGDREVTAVNLLLLIGQLEGSSAHLKYMGFEEDKEILDEMKRRYYKLYFKIKKEEKERLAGKKETK